MARESPDVKASDLAEEAELILDRALSSGDGSSPRNRARGNISAWPNDIWAGNESQSITPYGPIAFLAGWAHFRTENYETAIERLEQAADDTGWPGRGLAYPLLAMSFHKLGREQEAASAFQRSQIFFDQQLNDRFRQPRETPRLRWFDWIDFLILHRESQVLLQGETPTEDPRLRKLKVLAKAAIE